MNEPQVAQAGETFYGEALDALLARLRGGEEPALAPFLGDFPDDAAELVRVWPVVQLLERAKPPRALETTATPERLGDCRLLRELGRGGMGVVYLARQESLARDVAVKILTPAAQHDPQRVARFRRESQAVARLHHTHIVPVFGVGHEAGRDYLVMAHLPGGGLDAVIAAARAAAGLPVPETQSPATTPAIHDPPAPAVELTLGAALHNASSRWATPLDPRSPDRWRTISQWGAQAARGVAHAHDQGVWHRDIKPANLLLDAAGVVRVTDFGLAKSADEPPLTETGDVLGTLRYLAPEAFRGQWTVQADVYSLGLTLFELCALAPARAARERNELLAAVTSGEVPSLASVVASTPRDLATIIDRAVAADPRQRYATACELADDLTAFLEDRPIRARRQSWAERAARWTRRHPVPAAAAAIVAATVAVAFAAVWHARDQAVVAQQHALAQAEENRRNFRWAVETVTEYFATVADDESLRAAGLEPLRAELLERAQRFFDEFARERGDDAELHTMRSTAQLQLARIADELGDKPRALTLLNSLADECAPGRPELLADVWQTAGQIRFKLGEFAAAESLYARAIDVRRQLHRQAPEDRARRAALADLLAKQATTQLKLKRATSAEQSLDEAAALLDPAATDLTERETLASVAAKQAILYALTQRGERALATSRRTVALREALVQAAPRRPEFRDKLAAACLNLAADLADHGQFTSSQEHHQRAIALWDELTRSHPLVEIYRVNLSQAHRSLGHTRAARGEWPAAIAAYERAVRLREELAARHPQTPIHRQELAALWRELATVYEPSGDVAAARAASLVATALMPSATPPPEPQQSKPPPLR